MTRKQTPRPVARRAPTPQVPTAPTEPAETPVPAPDAHADPSPAAEGAQPVTSDPVALSISDDDGDPDRYDPRMLVGCPVESCPESLTRWTMRDGWGTFADVQGVPIVGCGNPWHYVAQDARLAVDPAPATAPAPAGQERMVTAREAGYTAEQEARAGIIEGGPGSTMYVVRISGGALARLLGLAGIRECVATVETA